MNRISEFSSRADGLAKRPREVFTSKQRLMHGSELSREVREVRDIKEIHSENVPKPAEKKQRRSFKDAIKMLAGGAAAAAVVAVSATTAAPVVPVAEQPSGAPVLEKYDANKYKYHYVVSLPTYRETLGPGGYAVVLDLSTEEKKQAPYDCYAEGIYEFMRFVDEKGEEFLNDPEGRGPATVFLSETEDNGVVISSGRHIKNNHGTVLNFSYMGLWNGTIKSYHGVETSIQLSDACLSGGYAIPDNLFFRAGNVLKMNDFSTAKEIYGNKTKEEILELITEPLDNHLFEVKRAEDGTEWKNTRYDTMNTLHQFTITQGKVDIIMPEYYKVVRDDELYGFKTLTIPEDGDYFLVTGSDEYPADKPYANGFGLYELEPLSPTGYSAAYFNYDWAEGTKKIFFPTTLHAHKNTTYNKQSDSHKLELSDFVYSQDFDEPQDSTGTQHIYYDLVAFNAERDTEIAVPQLSRLLPIEDKYYLYRLGYSTTYTITNNGDHEVVVIGNLFNYDDPALSLEDIASVNYRYNDGALGQFFNYEPLMPGESLTIYSSSYIAGVSGAATLTMPECCTVVDSSGTEYPHTGTQIDLLKGTTKED